MTLDYGRVQKYNIERGFGFVRRTVQANARRSDEVFFHISKIEARYPFAAYQLQGGYHYGISFWFETENTEKGERVSQVWLIADDIPNSQRDSFLAMIRSHWHNIDKSLPDWLEKVTCLFVGNSGLDELRQKRECLLHEHRKAEAEKKRLLEQEQRQAEVDRLAKLHAEQQERERAEAQREAQRQAEEAATQARLAVIQQPVRPLIALQNVHPQRIDYWNGIYVDSVRNCNINFGDFQAQTRHGRRPLGAAELVPYIAYYGGHHFYKLLTFR
jgi:cold shock CspA family protein